MKPSQKVPQKVTKESDPTRTPNKEKPTTTEPQEEFIEPESRPSRPATPPEPERKPEKKDK